MKKFFAVLMLAAALILPGLAQAKDSWREYQKGCREICGVKLPDGMRENQRFPEPIITPTTKADEAYSVFSYSVFFKGVTFYPPLKK